MKIKIGTRGSRLALAQSQLVANALAAFPEVANVELIQITTMGDKKQGTPQASGGDKRDWIHELELAVLDGSIDLAVHSGKDVPVDLDKDTMITSILEREHAFDAFVGREVKEYERRLKFSEIPKGGMVGTASLRRRAQIKRLRPDLELLELRGNVPTRLEKLAANPKLDGIVLASAGLVRLGFQDLGFERFRRSELLPAVNQGILCAQVRKDNDGIKKLLERIRHPKTEFCFQAERACIQVLEADCHSAVGVFSEIHADELTIWGQVLDKAGTKSLEAELNGLSSKAYDLGSDLGKDLLERGARNLLKPS